MEKENVTELWRWKLIKKLADYINQPDDSNMAEFKALIDSYRDYHKIKQYISS